MFEQTPVEREAGLTVRYRPDDLADLVRVTPAELAAGVEAHRMDVPIRSLW
jgi:hypothetical protein